MKVRVSVVGVEDLCSAARVVDPFALHVQVNVGRHPQYLLLLPVCRRQGDGRRSHLLLRSSASSCLGPLGGVAGQGDSRGGNLEIELTPGRVGTWLGLGLGLGLG